MKLILFIFAVFGTVEIIISGEPTRPLRWLFDKIHGNEFIRCPLCLGFWVGVFWGYWLLLDPVIFLWELPWYLAWLLNGCAGSGAAYLLHSFIPPSFDEGR